MTAKNRQHLVALVRPLSVLGIASVVAAAGTFGWASVDRPIAPAVLAQTEELASAPASQALATPEAPAAPTLESAAPSAATDLAPPLSAAEGASATTAAGASTSASALPQTATAPDPSQTTTVAATATPASAPQPANPAALPATSAPAAAPAAATAAPTAIPASTVPAVADEPVGEPPTADNGLGAGVAVVTTDVLNLRAAPGLDAAVVATLAEGDRVAVLAGPTPADGFAWFRVDADGVVGWSAGDFLRQE
jgi:hypothetical protein